MKKKIVIYLSIPVCEESDDRKTNNDDFNERLPREGIVINTRDKLYVKALQVDTTVFNATFHFLREPIPNEVDLAFNLVTIASVFYELQIEHKDL